MMHDEVGLNASGSQPGLAGRVAAKTRLGLLAALSAPARRVRWQIVGPFVVLSLATTAIGTYVATNLVGGSLADRFTNQLVEASRAASDSLVRRERIHLEWLRTAAFTEGVASAIGEGGGRLESLVLPIAANTGAERIAVYQPDGRLEYGLRLIDPDGLRYEREPNGGMPDWEPLRAVIEGRRDSRGDKFAGIIEDTDGAWLIGTAPILDGESLAGVALVGSRVSTVIAAARAESLSDVAWYNLDGRLVGSTLAAPASAEGDLSAVAPDHLMPGSTAAITASGRSYQMLNGDLVVRGERVGVYSVLLPTTFIANAQQAAGSRMAVLFAGGLLLTVLVGVVLANQLTSAVAHLVTTARRVTSGDLTARARMGRADEIGELGRSFDRMTEVLSNQMLGAVAALVSAIDARDQYTRGHSLRVGHLAALLGASMGLSEEHCHFLQVGGYLHDIGKIGVRDAVLLKPGGLEPDERASIQAHPAIGLEILGSVGLPDEVIAGVVGHHERLDGSGYPLGLLGEQLSIFPRIVSVADVYDALITDRPYRAGMPLADVLAELRLEVKRGHLDREVVATAHLVAAEWERRWRNDSAMSGFTLVGAPLDPRLFERSAVGIDRAVAHLAEVA